jgi:hypothetical protein
LSRGEGPGGPSRRRRFGRSPPSSYKFLPPKLRRRLFAAHFHTTTCASRGGRRRPLRSRSLPGLGRSDHDRQAPVGRRGRIRNPAPRLVRTASWRAEAIRLKVRKIATAHHADDQLETFVMRWLQGAGLKGCRASGPSVLWGKKGSLALVRPLLRATRSEIAAMPRLEASFSGKTPPTRAISICVAGFESS